MPNFKPVILPALLMPGLVNASTDATAPTLTVDSGDIAWMLIATVLVFLMCIPGLALFYTGLVRLKNAIAMQMQVLVCFALVLFAWIVAGYALTFSDFLNFSEIGSKVLMLGVSVDALFPVADGRAIPTYIHVLFQGAFAAITCAIVLGAIAERARFFGAMIFILIWLFLAYVPIAHMVWHHSTAQDGLLAGWKVLDYAGGLVVHVNAGVAGLCAAYMIDKRIGFGRSPLAPHSLSTVMTGTALLWIGWFGFNAGSALGANSAAALAFINTFIASSASCLVWVMVDKLRYGKSTALGAASGVLAGLVGITPAAGYVAPWAALVMGGLAAFFSFYAIGMVKRRWGIDDALDVFAIHGVSGLVGSLLVGVFAFTALGGNQSLPPDLGLTQALLGQVGVQALSTLVAIVVSALATFIALFCADTLTTLRMSEEDEAAGLDSVDHDETAYNFLNE